MNKVSIDSIKADCERQIAAILERLEQSTGCVVMAVALKETDVTTVADTAKQVLTAVAIDLQPAPRRSWET